MLKEAKCANYLCQDVFLKLVSDVRIFCAACEMEVRKHEVF